MRHAIQSIQASQIECWRVVNESAVFAPDEEMAAEVDIGPRAVDECSPSLALARFCGSKIRAPAPASTNGDQRFMGIRKT